VIHALARMAEGEFVETHEGIPPWVYGVGTFTVLMLMLFLVTRFDPHR
jgi:hypothetical protein